jgi:hypothetical protein
MDADAAPDASPVVVTTTGTIGGSSFEPERAVALGLMSGSGEILAVFMTNQARFTCSAVEQFASNTTIANLREIALNLLLVGSAVGEHPLNADGGSVGSATGSVEAAYVATGPDCQTSVSQNATDGSITITALGVTELSGSFHLVFGSAGTLDGTFAVPFCTAPDGGPAFDSATIDASEIDAGLPEGGVCVEL